MAHKTNRYCDCHDSPHAPTYHYAGCNKEHEGTYHQSAENRLPAKKA